MIKPDTIKLLEEMARGPYGAALKDFLDKEIENVGNLQNVTSWDDALGRKHALAIIKKIFSFLEKQPNKVDKSKDNYR